MTAASNIIDLGEWRERRDVTRQAETVIREAHAFLLQRDPAKTRRVMAMRDTELCKRHGPDLARLAPVIRELLLLRAAQVLAAHAEVKATDAALALACAAATLTGVENLANTMDTQIAALRATLPDELRRMEREYGTEFFAGPPPEAPIET